MFGVNVTYTMKPGKREEFLSRVQTVREAVLREKGCFRYDYFLPVGQPDQLLLVERWSGREAQQTHLKQPHMARMGEIKGDCVLDTALETYEI